MTSLMIIIIIWGIYYFFWQPNKDVLVPVQRWINWIVLISIIVTLFLMFIIKVPSSSLAVIVATSVITGEIVVCIYIFFKKIRK